MNKNIALFILIGLVSVSALSPALAQTKTPTSAPEKEASEEADTEETNAVKELKEKVESKVTELKNNNLRTKAGFITTIKDKKVTIESEAGPFTIEVDDDVTSFYRISGASRSEIKSEDLEKGNYILVTGPEIGNEITANTVHVDEHYIAKSGKIIEVNVDSFYVKIRTLEKDDIIIDIERGTKSQIIDIKTLELSTAGFSKLKEGDNLHFVAKRGQDKKQSRFSAVKIIIIPQEYFIK
jgi:cold shock CspA family protein